MHYAGCGIGLLLVEGIKDRVVMCRHLPGTLKGHRQRKPRSTRGPRGLIVAGGLPLVTIATLLQIIRDITNKN